MITSNTDGKGFPDSMDDKLLRDTEIRYLIHQSQNF